jgi:SET domain-containing protein
MGAFATRSIRKGARVIEYTGERITPKEADRRYQPRASADPRVLLFSVDDRITIDPGVGGNEAMFINHSCEPNCESLTDRRRVYIVAIRKIQVGEELTYDYNLTREDIDDEDIEGRYACNCGAKTCRGTILQPKPQAGPRT